MAIKASSIELSNFCSSNDDTYSSGKLVVPAFQRNYAWDKKHIKELISSIDTHSENYYIGNILVQWGRGSNSRDLIIDGQQRITSIFLIVRALLNLNLNRLNHELANSILFSDRKRNILRLEFSRTNLNNSFVSIMEEDFTEKKFSDSNSKKFLSNYFFIKKELIKIEDYNTFLKKISKILFVVIKFNEGYDVNQLFEGLNSKGKILSTVQLTKNALFGSSKDDINFQKIINIWEEIETGFEKNNVVWFDKFLRHTGFYKYGYISNKNLFSKIKDELKDSGGDLHKFSIDLKRDAELYLKIRNASLIKSDISASISHSEWGTIQPILLNFSLAELDQIYSVLFSLIRYGSLNPDYFAPHNNKSSFLKDIKMLWAFSILNKYLDTKPSLYERDFANLCHTLFENKSVKKDKEKFFIKMAKIVSDSSSDKFSKNINSRIEITGENDKKTTSKNNRNYVSQLLYFYLENGNKFSMEGFSIEHIIPKGKKAGLTKWKNISPKYLKEVSSSSRYKLGNLTLLSRDIGGNEEFDEKLKFYKKDKFKKNAKIKKYQIFFNSENPSIGVEKRGGEIGKEIHKLLIGLLK